MEVLWAGLEKYFYEKGIKREKESFWRWKGEVIFFLKSFERGRGEFEILWGNVFLGLGWGIFGLCMGRDDIWNIP